MMSRYLTDVFWLTYSNVNALAGRPWPEGSEFRIVIVEEQWLIRPTSVIHHIDSAEQVLVSAGLKASGDVLSGKPREAILEKAKRWNADLLVVGSHGRRGDQKLEKVMGKQTNIYITKPDHERLTKLIEIAREREGDANRKYLDSLEEELERAEVVQQKDIPADVITMRSTVRLKDLDTGEEMTYQLTFPTEANFDEGKISVLAPIGTAMIGYRHGDVIDWEVPSGVRRLRVEEVLYQPESKGEYHL